MRTPRIRYRGTEEFDELAHVEEEPPVRLDQPLDMGYQPHLTKQAPKIPNVMATKRAVLEFL